MCIPGTISDTHMLVALRDLKPTQQEINHARYRKPRQLFGACEAMALENNLLLPPWQSSIISYCFLNLILLITDK